MKNCLFLFDLDSTITKVEILPTIADEVGCGKIMRQLTEESMYKAVPFTKSFLDRVELLKELPVSAVSDMISKVPLNEELVTFLKKNKERSYIVTGNLDVWIRGLIERIGMEGHVFCSKGIVRDDRLIGVASVIDKDLTVSQFVGPFVAVGDGSNDAEMISKAEIGIGFGAVRPIAPSVLEVASHAVYDESRLVSFLEKIASGNKVISGSKTAIISCAGMGKRLGIGTTKCLVEIGGKTLLERHLEQLTMIDDVRVVVGYQANKVIEEANLLRRDLLYVFNHDFSHNGTGASVRLASRYANDLILTLDGDLLIDPKDLDSILNDCSEYICVTSPGTDNPVLCKVENGDVLSFSRESGHFEWTGVMQVQSIKLGCGDGHVYELIESRLPIKVKHINTREIDTPNDYESAVKWVNRGFQSDFCYKE